MSYLRLSCDVRARRLYTCSVCGAQQQGEQESFSLQTSEPADLKQFLDKRPLSPSCMPIGWSTHHGAKQTVFRCQAHHEETACAK